MTFDITRRGAIGLGLAMTLAAPLSAQTMEEMAAQAADGPPVLWYESSQSEQAAQIIDAFNETFPDIAVEHVRSTGGNNLAVMIQQEAQAGIDTASLATGGISHLDALAEANLLMDLPDVGINDALVSGDHLVNTAASVYVALWNTDAVADDEAPTTWDAFTDPKWKGRIGTWIRSAGFANLAQQMGEDEVARIVEGFAGQEPLLFQSTFPLAQQVAAGEVDVAMGIYHTAQPPIRAGAPLKVGALDPTPVNTIWSGIVEAGGNVAGATVLLAWLVSPEGAAAYESATDRGNALIDGTETAKLLEGVTLSEWPAAETETYSELQTRFNEVLASGGTER